VESLVRKFEHVRFEPSGMTRNPEIPIAKSLIDYIFRWLAMEFVTGYREANAPKRPVKKIESAPAPAPIPSPSQGEGKGEGSASIVENPSTSQPRKKEGNGHGRHIEHDVKPFDYTGEESPKTGSTSAGESSPQLVASLRLTMAVDPLSQQGSDMQSDAPACDVCGSITVRSGTCYKCLNCGNSMGCS
jgi:ribonucleoside-diphosphate reductase alpha chain